MSVNLSRNVEVGHTFRADIVGQQVIYFLSNALAREIPLNLDSSGSSHIYSLQPDVANDSKQVTYPPPRLIVWYYSGVMAL